MNIDKFFQGIGMIKNNIKNVGNTMNGKASSNLLSCRYIKFSSSSFLFRNFARSFLFIIPFPLTLARLTTGGVTTLAPSECARSHKYLASSLPVLRLDLRFSEWCCIQAWLRHRWQFPRTVRFSGLASMKGRKAPARHHGALSSMRDCSRARGSL